jgi:hypothetical protein
MPRSFAVVLLFVAATAAQAAPVITSVQVVVTNYSMDLVVTGSDLSQGVLMLDSQPIRSANWSPTAVHFDVTEGTGKNHTVSISVNGQQVSSMPFSYPPPTIRHPLSPLPQASPGDTLHIYGTGFGGQTNKPAVTVGGNVCPVTKWSSTVIECTLPQGRGAAPVRVVAGDQASNDVALAILRPRIDSIDPASGPTVGGTRITIKGIAFGTSGGVTIGNVLCPSSDWSDTTVVCTVPAGQGRSWPVSVNGSNEMGFTYDAPVIANVAPVSGPWNGGVAVTLRGVNFGTSASVTIGGQPCAVVGQSQAIIQCTLPASNGVFPGAVPVIVNVSNQQSAPASFTYLAP